MLVLSRREAESIVIPGIGTVKVLSIRGKRVRLGLEFPPEMDIQRVGPERPAPDADRDADQAAPVTI